MNVSISRTDEGVKKYPQHKHSFYEIMLYTEGEGNMMAGGKAYPFSPGTIVIVPPKIAHGSVSESGFCNISIGGDFSHILSVKSVTVLNNNREAELLAALIYENRFASSGYINALCEAYLYSISEGLYVESGAAAAVREIASKISASAFDSEINVNAILSSTGYAEDYIRAEFGRIVGKPPIEFLTELRIKRAAYLIEIYGENIELSEIAAMVGFTDYAYFSRRFKFIIGISPKQYRNALK